MKISAVVMLVLLIAAAIVMVLRVREISHVKKDVETIVPHLREEGVTPEMMGHREAAGVIAELEHLVENPSLISTETTRLKEIVSKAASWAAGAPAPSPELEAAVAIRQASNDLREYGTGGSNNLLRSARSHLMAARNALAGNVGEAQITDGIRDRVKSLEQAQREHLQELEEAY